MLRNKLILSFSLTNKTSVTVFTSFILFPVKSAYVLIHLKCLNQPGSKTTCSHLEKANYCIIGEVKFILDVACMVSSDAVKFF